jgi:hypothetical protein
MNDFISLSFMAEQIITIVGIGIEIEAPQAPFNTELEHGLLVGTQGDARLRVDEAAKPGKISIRDAFVVARHGMNVPRRGARLRAQTAISTSCLFVSATLVFSGTRMAANSSAEKTRSMSRIMMNCVSRLPIPLMKSVRIWVPILGAG